MQEYNTVEHAGRPNEIDLGISLSPLGIITAIGFATVILSTFLNFTPISEVTWRAGGVGFPVMLSCMAGCILALRKSYFSAFFIGIFAAFFLTHEIIIVYDTHAIEIGQELKPDGWFRSVIMVYQDALRPGFGALWAMIGVLLASVTPLIGMAAEVRRKNLEAAKQSEEASSDFAGPSVEAGPDTEDVEWAEQFFSGEDEGEGDDEVDDTTLDLGGPIDSGDQVDDLDDQKKS